MTQQPGYNFSEEYLIPVYVAPYDTIWLSTCRGDKGPNSFKMNVVAVRAVPGAERESMIEAIDHDISEFEFEIAKNPDAESLKANVNYLKHVKSMFGTVYEKEIKHIHADWKSINANIARQLVNNGLTQFNVDKGILFSGISGQKIR